MKLTNEDVQEILQLLDAGTFGELHLQTLRFKLVLRRGGDGEWTQSAETLSAPRIEESSAAGTKDVAHPQESVQAPKAQAQAQADHLVPVQTPLLGTFYRAPKPGAAPFVQVGDRVDKDTVIGIVETMKLMNSVYAGASGCVAEVCAGDGEFVEQHAVLMRIEADR